MNNIKKIGIIAGGGDLPSVLAVEAKQHGRQPVVIGITNATSDSLSQIASEFHQYHIGQLKKIITTLRDANIREIALIGKVHKDILLKPTYFDPLALKILAKSHKKSDRSLLKIIVEELETFGCF